MDGEKTALYKRRSSILKTGKSKSVDEDDHTGEMNVQRRVSFASKYAIKPFTHDAEANTIWDATYEEVAIHSDQSTSHTTTDSVSHMSIEVSTICQASQHSKCPVGSNPVLNATCTNMNENIQTETEVFQKSKQHKPKFGIYVEGPTKLDAVIPELNRDIFMKPCLLKENIKTNNALELSPTNTEICEEDMQLEITKTFSKDDFKQKVDHYSDDYPMDIIKNIEGNYKENNDVMENTAAVMEFTTDIPINLLHFGPTSKKTVHTDSSEDNHMDITSNSCDNDKGITAICENVEVNTSISAILLTGKVNKSIEDDSMEFTSVIPTKRVVHENVKNRKDSANHIMKVTNASNKQVNFNPIVTSALKKPQLVVDDVDMEFTKVISLQLLEKLRFENVDTDNNDNENAMDLTRKHIANDYCNNVTESCSTECDMDLEKYDNNKIPRITITTALTDETIDTSYDNNKIPRITITTALTDETIDTSYDNNKIPRITITTALTDETIDTSTLKELRIQSGGESIKIVQAAVTNTIEDPDILPIISNRRESSFFRLDGSFNTNPTSEVDDTQYLINYKLRVSEETPLDRTDIYHAAAASTFPVLKMVDIPKVIEAPIKTHQICIDKITPRNNKGSASHEDFTTNIPTEDNNQRESQKTSASDISPTSKNSLQLHTVKETLSKSNVSVINVFKPSSKNNTRCSFYEPMELGTPHITVVDVSNSNLNISCESTTENSLKYREVADIAYVTESATALEAEVVTTEARGNGNRSRVHKTPSVAIKASSVNSEKLLVSETTVASLMEADTNRIDILKKDELNKCSEGLKENSLQINCYETDNIIFTTEAASSFEIEKNPTKAYGILRQSMSGVAEGHSISTHKPSQELANTFQEEEECLKSICREAKHIVDDTLDVCPHEDDDDDEFMQDLSKCRVVLYDSNDEAEDNQKSDQLSVVRSPLNKPKPLNKQLPRIPTDCSLDQLYDLLGWSAEERPNVQYVPSKFSEEFINKNRAESQLRRFNTEKRLERFVQSCCEMLETMTKFHEEDEAQAAEDLAINQGRSILILSLHEWIRQQKKMPSTLWSITSLTNSECVVCSRNVQFHLEFETTSYVITNLHAQIDPEGKPPLKLRQYVRKLIMDKTQKSHIHGAIGVKFNLRSFLEYLQMKLEHVVEIEGVFIQLFGKVLIEARLSFDDNLALQYLLIGRSRWLLKIDCSDPNNLSENSIMEMTTLDGVVKVPEREIKNLAKKCPKGIQFLSSFVDVVYEFRNNRERRYCDVLDALLIKIEMKTAKP